VVELAEIFRLYGPAYREKYGAHMPPSHLDAMTDIEQCRTEVLGGHVYQCPECGEKRYSYHSCQNRHCPKCQNAAGQEWLEQQQALLLPVPYFLLTCTLPEALRELARSHQKLLYGLLFRTSAAAAQQLAQDPRFVGGTLGMIGVLHTWTRALIYHPHIHYLVPGGGLATDGSAWQPAREGFLLPVRALSVLFRAKFRDALQQTELFAQIPPEVWTQDWVVHCQPVGDGAHALKYLAPYIFRVAISNRRIRSVAMSPAGGMRVVHEVGWPAYNAAGLSRQLRPFSEWCAPARS
jgi:ribosomal protein L37AE/L43A